MTVYQEMIAGLLDDGWRMREAWNHSWYTWTKVVKLVKPDGTEHQTLNARTVKALVGRGYEVEPAKESAQGRKLAHREMMERDEQG